MAERYPGDAAAANGFGRNWLYDWEARLLYEAGYPAPPDMRGTGNWQLSLMGFLVPQSLPVRISWPRSMPPASA